MVQVERRLLLLEMRDYGLLLRAWATGCVRMRSGWVVLRCAAQSVCADLLPRVMSALVRGGLDSARGGSVGRQRTLRRSLLRRHP